MVKTLKLIIPTLLSLSLAFSCARGKGGTVDPVSPSPQQSQVPDTPPPVDPNPSNQPQADNGVELNILSQNCWGVPRVVVYNPTKDQVERFNNIGTVINGFDIVNLQETFGDNAKLILDKANYPTKYRLDNTSFLSLNGGLTSFSKFPLVKKDYMQFSECAGSDCYANKGVLFLRLNIPNIGEVDLYNTHYQAIDSKEDKRLSDNREFENFLKRNDVGNLTIITGDFNFTNYDATDSTSKAFLDFKKRFNPIDTFRLKNPNIEGFTSNPNINDYVGKGDKPERLDYIFVLRENRGIQNQKYKYKVEVAESKIMFDKPVNGKFLSDHFGLFTKLRIHIE